MREIMKQVKLLTNINLYKFSFYERLRYTYFKKTYDLYKEFYKLRLAVPKQDRYVLWQKCENTLITVLEGILMASQQSKTEKLPILEKISIKLNFLKVCVRLMKDVKSITPKAYIIIEADLDEIGKMLGEWIKSIKER